MNEQERYRLKLEATKLYYLENMASKDIAEQLNISRPTLKKFLNEARDEGIVKIEVCDIRKLNQFQDIEDELKQRLSLREVKVVESAADTGEAIMDGIARDATGYIQQLIQSNMLVGIGWGKTLEVIARNMLPVKSVRRVSFMPVLGGPGTADHCSMFANNLCEVMSANYSGSEVNYVYAPLFAGTPETKEVYENLPNISAALDNFNHLDMMITAIDSDIDHSTTLKVEDAKPETRQKLKDANVAGSMCARFYDIDGNECMTELTDRTIAISVEQIRKTPIVVAVGGGAHKVGSIIGGARAKLYNILVTDIYTGESILKNC